MNSGLFSKGHKSCSIDNWLNCRVKAEKNSENQFSLSRINHGKTQIVAHHSWDLRGEESNQHSKDSAASCTREKFFLTAIKTRK